MRPAREGDIPVRVKNSYNPKAPGTLIAKGRDMDKVVLTSIVLKSNVTMLDIVSTRMLGHFGFLAKNRTSILVNSLALAGLSLSNVLQQPAVGWVNPSNKFRLLCIFFVHRTYAFFLLCDDSFVLAFSD